MGPITPWNSIKNIIPEEFSDILELIWDKMDFQNPISYMPS